MKKRNTIFSIIIFFAVLGIIDAGYLGLTALASQAPICNFIHGCDLVAASPYSLVFGIPLGFFGVFFYTMVVGVSLWGIFDKQVQVRMFLIPLVTIGLILSLYFLYLQAFIIQAYCEYCLFSLFVAVVLFILSFFVPKTSQGILNEMQKIAKE